MELLSWHKTDVGKKRKINQDTCLLDADIGLYILADGMGGQPGGGEASQISANAARNMYKELYNGKNSPSREQYFTIIQKMYDAARNALVEFAKDKKELNQLGTTLVLALFCQDRGTLYIGNVGDSRAYLFKNSSLWQLTEDHTLLNELLKTGSIDDPANFTKKNILTRAIIASNDKVQCDVMERKLEVGEFVILCSDGLHGMVDDRGINKVLCDTEDSSQVPSNLVNLANQMGGDDNVSVVLLKAVEN